MRRAVARWFLRRLTRPRKRYQHFADNDVGKLKATIRPGDVLLVDGNQRVSQAIKYLTMSTWSHSALYIGDALLARDAATRNEVQRRFGREARHLVVEALVEKGVVVSPLAKYADFNVRICRPVGLKPDDLRTVVDYVIARIGFQYDRRNFWDLTRYLLPFAMIPPQLREDALHFGSGRDTETICSSLLAEAFGAIRFPILPVSARRKPRTALERLRQQILGRPTRWARSGLLRARHPTLCVPRDFDLSPYFDIVKFDPRASAAFDYRRLEWEGSGMGGVRIRPGGRPTESR